MVYILHIGMPKLQGSIILSGCTVIVILKPKYIVIIIIINNNNTLHIDADLTKITAWVLGLHTWF